MSNSRRTAFRAGLTVANTPWRFALLLALCVPALPQTALAQASSVEMVCPYDGTKFTFQKPAAAPKTASTDMTLDMMPLGTAEAPKPLAACPSNGFVFWDDAFTPAELEQLRPLVLSPEFQALKNETTYYRAYWLMKESRGGDHNEVTWLLLQATWQARDSAERYKRYATELIGRLSEDIFTAKPGQKFTYQILYGELLRRLGRFDEAKPYFAGFDGLTNLPPTAGPLIALEKDLVAKGDTAQHRMAEVTKK